MMYEGNFNVGRLLQVFVSTIRRSAVRRSILAAATWLLAPAGADTVQAATVYVYKDARGAALITDHPRSIPGYTLFRRYGVDDGGRPYGDDSPGRLRALQSDYDAMIDRVAGMSGIDAALIKAVIHAESAFDPSAVSHKGAVGLMQLMAATADAYGVTDRRDPWQNLLAGATHLRDLLERYRDTSLALAAYNAGAEAVSRYGGIPPYSETRDYVRKVLRLHDLYREQG